MKRADTYNKCVCIYMCVYIYIYLFCGPLPPTSHPFLAQSLPHITQAFFDSLCIPSLAQGPVELLSSCFRSHIKCHLLRETSPSHPKLVPLSHRHTCVCTRSHRHTHMLALFSIKNLRPFIMACVFVWRRKWQLTPVFLPGKSHGQRSLAGYSPWGRKVGHD